MSKAFTKEDDDAGVSIPPSASFVVPARPFRITTQGASFVRASTDARVRESLARADVLAPVTSPERAAVGVTVHVTLAASAENKAYRLVTSEERGLTNDGCSVASPLGRALLGAEVGDVREVRTPRGAQELEVVALTGEEISTATGPAP
ncbi:MAG: GreA/GreB family elongation factor [Polyangiaceae bacterium]